MITIHTRLFLSGVFSVGSSVPWQYFYVSQSMTWYDAQSYCRTNYIDLVTVGSLVEVNSVTAFAKAAAPGYSGSVWLGLHRSWTWATGELYSGQIPFYSDQPNEGNDGAACGVMDVYGLGDWYCSTQHYFVCYDGIYLKLILHSLFWPPNLYFLLSGQFASDTVETFF